MKRHFDIIGAPSNQLGFVTTQENTVDGLRRMDEMSWVGLTDWIKVRNDRWGADIIDQGDVVISDEVHSLISFGNKDEALRVYAHDLTIKVLASYKRSGPQFSDMTLSGRSVLIVPNNTGTDYD
ncbi:hypothetical protein [Vibrio furnissii]|uniref:hypothetical protein n=1 Tax=Vibrio furnissii TaxID=29494 RepID=UPI001E34D70A|nr:hypothetical protein [Vibrio furnissii]UHJ63259.1 hypothetical protein LUM42_19900 [Vibrio furnissii]